jgi:hypothetical protein
MDKMGAIEYQDLRAFRGRDDVTLERFLAFRGASAAASLSIAAEFGGAAVAGMLSDFLEFFGPASLGAERRVLVDRFSVSSSVSSSTTSAASTAFPLPLPLLLVVPVSGSTVVLVEEADEERARFELLPAAETAVDEPEENDGDRSRVRRGEGRDGNGLVCAFLFPVSLMRPRDVPAWVASSFVDGWDSDGSEEVMVSGLGVASAFPWVSGGDGVADLMFDASDGPALFSIGISDCSTIGKLVSSSFSFSSDLVFLTFLRAGSGASEGSLVLSS